MIDLQKQIERLQVELKPLADLVPDQKNAKVHSPFQIDLLARLIETYGFTSPIVVVDGGKILAGHGRRLAAKKLGLKIVPTVDVSHLTEEERRAFMLADNRSAEVGVSYDMDILLAEMSELAEGGFDLNLTGFTKEDLDRMLGEELPGKGGVLDDGDKDEKAPSMTVPLLLELSRADFQRWKSWRADRDDMAAFRAAMDELERE